MGCTCGWNAPVVRTSWPCCGKHKSGKPRAVGFLFKRFRSTLVLFSCCPLTFAFLPASTRRIVPLIGNVQSSRWPRSFVASSPLFLLALTAGVFFGDANLFPARVSSQDLSFSCCVVHNQLDKPQPVVAHVVCTSYGFDACLVNRVIWKRLQDSRPWSRASSKRERESASGHGRDERKQKGCAAADPGAKRHCR